MGNVYRPNFMRMLNFRPLLLACSFFALGSVSGQAFSTYVYEDTLALDLFLPSGDEDGLPLVLFVHGGGFSGGNRADGHDLCEYLAAEGIACASMSYVLSMRGRTQDWGCDGILPEKMKTIQLAANNTWSATDFLLDRAESLGLDTSRFFLAGSSAGAEAVLGAAYYDRVKMAMGGSQLATTFDYAGLISGAGAMIDLNLITPENALPSQFFHGDSDPVVPYATAAHHFCQPDQTGWLMLFGSASIADHLESLNVDFELITHAGAGHEIAGRYFGEGIDRIVTFVERVSQERDFQMREVIRK